MAKPRIPLEKELIQTVIAKTASIREAAVLLRVSYPTFIRRAKEHGVYVPNQGKRGFKGRRGGSKFVTNLEDVFSNKVYMQSSRLKERLFQEGIKIRQCEECGVIDWQGKPLVLHLEHSDGDKFNNAKQNLKILCPNCHSQTPTYCRGQGKYN